MPALPPAFVPTSEQNRQELGQFFTPEPVADFMAALFTSRPGGRIRLLDAGAGAGALLSAFVCAACASEHRPDCLDLTAYELDATVLPALGATLARCETWCHRAGIHFAAHVIRGDFLEAAPALVRNDLFSAADTPFDAAILNPPYRKIHGASEARARLRSAGIETANLYTGFLALAARMLAPGGELVAIVPRSFCNGPYFRSFRGDFLSRMALRRLHLFNSRRAAFRADAVLQENLIIHAVRTDAPPAEVIISTSAGLPTEGFQESTRPYAEVVSPSDPEAFIHIAPADAVQEDARRFMGRLSTPLHALGLEVSTGRVVDFRARDYLRSGPAENTCPLIYPCHLHAGGVRWPILPGRKPNAIQDAPATANLLVPAGRYVLTKRFTSKEERRRVVASLYDPDHASAAKVGFENHLNYFHVRGAGLPLDLARGLTAFLNCSLVDRYFRQFNGHTQVNATDLRNLAYPRRDQLEDLGARLPVDFPDQDCLDSLVTAAVL